MAHVKAIIIILPLILW